MGNTLTGEFTRANVLRLRWPYVRRTVAAALKAEGWDDDRLATFLADLEATYKSPFPSIDEDTLAGGLSNTIAGRICNHFDLNGGGYTVDGACSSSLLAVATAAKGLVDGDIDVALAGGSTCRSTRSRSSASRRPAPWPRASSSSTTAVPTASGPARAAAWSC
nr:hypothetical protein GCM10020093_073970 [Planobispora longispora]